VAEALTFVIGVGITAFLLFFIYNSLPEEHKLLKFFLLMSVLALMLILPKSFGDSQEVCETVVANSTELNSSVTSYEYESFCFTKETTTTTTFMQTVFWIYRLIIGYIIVYLMWKALEALGSMRGGRNG